MKLAFAVVLLAATAAAAQPSKPAPPTCGDCGVVRSVRGITEEIRPSQAQEETRPSGFVASIPLKGGKPSVGSSTTIGRDAPTTVRTWEVIVRMEDDKFRVVVLDHAPDLHEGDKVRFDQGKLVPRD